MLQIKKKFNLTKLLFEGNNISSNQSALVWNNTEITRKELFNNIIKNADYLLKSGLKEGERVVLLLNDSPAIYEFFLGSISIGAIPILINPKTKLKDLLYILKDSKASVVVTEILSLEDVENIYNNCPYIDSRNKIIIQDRYISNLDVIKNNKEYFYPRSSKAFFLEEDEIEMSFVSRDKDAPAFWQYTSGTTGKPKAVIHSQISMLSNTINFAEKTLNITSEDKIYSIPKMFFGYGLGNSLFFPIWTGAKVLIDDNWPNEQTIVKNIKKFKPTIFFAIPKIYKSLLNKENLKDYENVRIFYSAGHNLNSLVNKNWKQLTGKNVTQGIGCTEIGHVYISNIPTKENINSTGIPINGFDVKINLDSENNSGELYVRPTYSLLGYNGKNDKNKFSNDNWYKTGDNFSKDKDGDYKFLARIDEMFKVNGRKVIPSIIESYVLERYPVLEAIYLGIEDETFSDIITHLCLVLKKPEDELKLIEEIKNDLNEKFESFLRPNNITIFEGFKYNSNGKIMKKEIKDHLSQTILG